MPEYRDRVKDQTQTTGTGTLTIDGVAATGYRTITAAHTTGSSVRYTVINATGSEWEVGEGVWTAASNTLTRATVYSSSNAGSLVNFSAGAKVVFTGPVAKDLQDIATTYLALSGTGAGTMTGKIAMFGVTGDVFDAYSAGTGSITARFNNSGGNFYVGRDNSTGGQFSGVGYASVLFSSGAYPLIIYTNAVERARFDGSTGALTLSNNLSVNGTITFGGESAGYLNVPQNSKSAAYTLVLADAGKHILHPSADTTARTFTIPANSAVAFPIGTAVTFVNQASAGSLTIAITTDTMRLAGAGTTGSRTLAANGIATAIKLTATEWIISGTNLT